MAEIEETIPEGDSRGTMAPEDDCATEITEEESVRMAEAHKELKLAGGGDDSRPSAVCSSDYDRTGENDEVGEEEVDDDKPEEEIPEGVDYSILTEIPYLNDNYNETYLYLVPKDYESLFVLWEVGEEARIDLVERFGQDFFDKNSLILRVYQVSGVEFDGFNANHVFEVDDQLHWKNNYWVKVMPGESYVAEIGYRAHGTTFFEFIARSNTVFIPKGKPENAENYCDHSHIEVDGNMVEVPVEDESWRFNQYKYWRERTHTAPPEKGCWALVLHQHLPFVHHPEYRVSLEEQWFFEAIVSVYTQLLNVFWNLEKDRVDFRITLSLTPPLLSMMQDPLLQTRVSRHIDQLIELATKERDNSAGKPWHDTTEQILHRYWIAKEVFDAYEGDLTRGFKDFQDMGKLEIITCPATHMLLPLYMHFPEAIKGQIRTAKKQYERTFGRPPRGMWLPENAYTPGLDKHLADEGIKWFIVNSNGIDEGDTKAFYGTNAPVITSNGVACFGIDQETRAQVWSRQAGYPGHPNYKEWYRDLGYEADWDYLPKYFKTADVRRNTGMKYYRITSKDADLGAKDYYNVAWAKETVHEQAGQFVYYRGVQANHIKNTQDITPCVLSAYDAELFGHWWEEGPEWIESVFRKMCYDQQEVRPVTPSEYLAEHKNHQRMTPGASSWGKKDYFSVWVDGRDYQPNCWVYRHYFRLAGKLIDLATKYKDNKDEKLERILNQIAREFCLAVASDWGFLIETGQAVRYSEMQIITHLDRCKELMRQMRENDINDVYLKTIETADSIFPYGDMDFRVFARD